MGRVRAERAALAAVVILTLVLRVPSAISHAILGYDDGVYLASVGAMRRGELPFREVYSSQGPAFLAILRAGDLATASASWGPRLAPLVAGIACTLIAYRLAARLSGTPGGLLAGFLCATSGGLLYSTTRIESDGIAAALGAAAVLAACAPGRRRVLATGLLVGLGLSVKSVLVVPAAVAAAVLVWRRVGPAAAAWMTAVAAATVALLFAVWGWPGVWAQFVTLHLRVHGHIPPGARLEDLGQGLWHLDRWLVALVVTGVVSAGIAVARHGSGRDGLVRRP